MADPLDGPPKAYHACSKSESEPKIDPGEYVSDVMGWTAPNWAVTIRPLALIRKNALFAASDRTGDSWEFIATLLDNCNISRINPDVWLTDTLAKMAISHPANAVGELVQWNASP